MYWVLAIGLFASIMFGWGGYQALDGRMVGRPWLFIRAGVWQVAIGAIVVAAGHTLVHTLYPRLIELSGVAESMVMGVASSLAGALFGMGVTVKATNLRAEDVRRIDRQKAFVDELKEMLKGSSEEEKSKVIQAFLMERRELAENAKRAAIDLD